MNKDERIIAACDFEAYVVEILRGMPDGLNQQAFRARCHADLVAGYAREVEEATRRYFAAPK
jgi:hypothetical protein